MPVYVPKFKTDVSTQMLEGREMRELREAMDKRSLEILEPVIASVLLGDPGWREVELRAFTAFLHSVGRGPDAPRSVSIDRGEKSPIRVYYVKAAYLADPHPMSVEASHMVAFRVGAYPGFRQWVKA